MARQQEATVVQGGGGNKGGGILGKALKAFLPMAAGAVGGPYAGAAAKAATGFLTGDPSQMAEGGADVVKQMGGEETPEEAKKDDNEEPVMEDGEILGATAAQQPAPQTPAQPELPYTPEQLKEQELAFRFIDQNLPNLPVFLSQNPEMFPAFRGFLDQAETRYKGGPQQ